MHHAENRRRRADAKRNRQRSNRSEGRSLGELAYGEAGIIAAFEHPSHASTFSRPGTCDRWTGWAAERFAAAEAHLGGVRRLRFVRGAVAGARLAAVFGLDRAGRRAMLFCQATVTASPSVSSSTCSRWMRVHPERPQAPLSGSKAEECSSTNLCCWSGVSTTMPRVPSWFSVANIRPFTRKSGWPMCALSTASRSPSTIRRKSLAFSIVWH